MSVRAVDQNMPMLPNTPSARVIRSVKQWIEQGVLVDGQPLPSERALSEELGVARKTVRRALAIMENDGLLRASGGGPRIITSNSVSRGRLMENSVFILTRVTTQNWIDPRQSGWEAYVTHGAMHAIYAGGWHAISLQPSLLSTADLRQLVSERPRGVIISDVAARTEEAYRWATALQEASIPVVIYGGSMTLSEFDRVVSDHEDGCYQLTRWLIQQGCQRILPVWWTSSISGYWYLPRCAGYARAMIEAGLKPMSILEVPDIQRIDQDKHAWLDACTAHFSRHLKESLTGPRAADALLLDSDGSVAASAAACRWLDREPGKDILLAGYDNYWPEAPEREWEPTPPSVTIDKQNLTMGAELVQLLKERMDGLLPAEPQCRIVPPRLIVTGI